MKHLHLIYLFRNCEDKCKNGCSQCYGTWFPKIRKNARKSREIVRGERNESK